MKIENAQCISGWERFVVDVAKSWIVGHRQRRQLCQSTKCAAMHGNQPRHVTDTQLTHGPPSATTSISSHVLRRVVVERQ